MKIENLIAKNLFLSWSAIVTIKRQSNEPICGVSLFPSWKINQEFID